MTPLDDSWRAWSGDSRLRLGDSHAIQLEKLEADDVGVVKASVASSGSNSSRCASRRANRAWIYVYQESLMLYTSSIRILRSVSFSPQQKLLVWFSQLCRVGDLVTNYPSNKDWRVLTRTSFTGVTAAWTAFRSVRDSL